MPVSASLRARLSRALPSLFIAILFTAFAALCPAASIRGVVTDASGAKVTGATVTLLSSGKVVATAVSTADGSFQILTGVDGRFFLVVSATSFRQLETPGFYAGRLDNIERNVVLEPEWARESIVVTATGTPTPQAQTSAATSVLGPLDLALQDDLLSSLRLMPGTFVVQTGQMGGQASLFVRGGDSDDNKILVDGVDAGDIGNRFDFGPFSTTAVESAEVYRGPNSNLYGAGAESGVVSMTTPHGTTSFPSLLFHGEAGSLNTSREELEVAGAHNKFDYLGAFSWLQTSNDLPNDEYHVATTAANLGWQPNGNTQVRATLHYGVDAAGVPNAWDFYHVADQATEKDQNIFASASIDNQTTADFHQSVRYALTRKREQYYLWQLSGSGTFDAFGDSFGEPVTITGANGYSVTGQALLDFPPFPPAQFPEGHQLVSNRDQLMYQGDYRFTPHITGMIGFHFEDERGADPNSSENPVDWNNYDYLAAVHGDFKNRFYYTLGGSLEHFAAFGTQTSPRAGISYYALKPRKGIFSGTRVLFNYGDAVREPALTDEFFSLYSFLLSETTEGGPATIQQFDIKPLSAPYARTYEGGVEQTFFGERLAFRTSFFHNEFGRQIEYVGVNLVPELLPNLNTTQQNLLEEQLNADGAFEFSINSEAFRALGVETTVEGGIGRNIFLRGGYTYLDAVIQRSFTNDELSSGLAIPTYNDIPNGIPIGSDSPLVGARPFRRAPHTGFFTASYATRRLTGVFNSAFAGRSDDSDFLGFDDLSGGNSLLLPNRNLDHGYAKLDLGGSYSLLSWLAIYGQAENLLNIQHIAPIGYPSLPITVRAGLRMQWGIGSKQ
jgi:vitamin B12 transporter